MGWFGPFMLATSVAVAADVGLSAFVYATMTPAAPQAPPRVESPPATAEAPPKHVTIEPLRIEVIARRTPVQFEVRANPAPERRQPG